MSEFDDPRSFRLHFEGAGAQGHAVPARVLADSIRRLQQVVYLLAGNHRGVELRRRFKPSRALETDFTLVCKAPAEGGFALPLRIGAMPEPAPKAADELAAVGRAFRTATRAAGSGDVDDFYEIVADPNYRKRILDAYRDIPPPPRFRLALSIEDGRRRKLFDSAGVKIRAQRAVPDKDRNDRKRPDHIAGALTGMSFARRRMRIERHDGRSFDIDYSGKAEDNLLDWRRRLLHVYGTAEIGDDGDVKSFVDIDEIREVDQFPVEIESIEFDGVRRRAVPPLRFDVRFDRKDLLYDLNGPFEIRISAESRRELEEALMAELDMLWAEYAQEKPDRLSAGARRLRTGLLERFRIAR